MEELVIGVDVGTGSARAALVSAKNGRVLRSASKPILTWNPRPNHYQQSTSDIWSSVCFVVKEVCKGVDKSLIKGIGFDATCSLVALDAHDKPVTVSLDFEPEQNVILWMDHRAEKEAEFINTTKHPRLANVGGQISLESQIPKLLWMKTHLKSTWSSAAHFMDLSDFLTYKATGIAMRSLCSTACKWLFHAGPQTMTWDASFMETVGLSDLLENNCPKIGNNIQPPGTRIGGLTKDSALDLGLNPSTAVSVSIIDAHAGVLGIVGCRTENTQHPILTKRLSLICGTSTCHMALSTTELFVKGVWGPYFSVILPGMWLSEAGQSAAGILIDELIAKYPAALSSDDHPSATLNAVLDDLAAKRAVNVDELTRDIHVYPDFHGNRSPLADPTVKGMISGLGLNTGVEELAVLYLATLQALAYGTRHIIEEMESAGHSFDEVLICGGLSKNPRFVQIQADSVSKDVLLPESDGVLVGSAMLAASAAHLRPTLLEAVLGMGPPARKIQPVPSLKLYHDMKYKVFRAMYEHQMLYRKMMNQ